MVAEVLGGELYLFPRPRFRHARNASTLGGFLLTAFDLGITGPGGWVIMDEPELHLGPAPNEDIIVPDIAGWREGRLAERSDDDPAYLTIPPDWVCEVLSPSTKRVDRLKKMPIYARERVRHVWLADPIVRMLEVYRFERGHYTLVSTLGEEPIRAEPFEEVEIAPTFIWGRIAPPPGESSVKPTPPKRPKQSAKKKRS